MNIFLWNVWGLLYRWIKGVKVDTLLCPLEVLKILWKPENVVQAKCHTRISNQYINQIGKWPIKCLNSLCQGSADFSIIWFDNGIWPRIFFEVMKAWPYQRDQLGHSSSYTRRFWMQQICSSRNPLNMTECITIGINYIIHTFIWRHIWFFMFRDHHEISRSLKYCMKLIIGC